MRQIRTDLAMEAAAGRAAGELPGVTVSGWETGDISVTEVTVDAGEGARLLGKAPGRYLTLAASAEALRDSLVRAALSNLLGEELARMLPPDDGHCALVVGLGNRGVTPDALGPRAAEGTFVTRHLFREMPERLDGRVRCVCMAQPGVLGVTGVETFEMVRALAKELDARCVIAVDSLAARSVSRLGCTVQISDTGIQPGSGVGNHRRALNRESLGIPVIAVGVPMVIYAGSIVRDALEAAGASEKDAEALEAAALKGAAGELIVTPREIDELVENLGAALSLGVNLALQPELGAEDFRGA